MKIKRMDVASSAALFMYAASIVITPICLLRMTEEFSLTFTNGGALGGAKSFLILAALLVSGLCASLLGKQTSIGIGMLIVGITLIGSGFAGSYRVIMGLMLLMGIGSGLIEALTNPLVHDAHPKESNKYLNYINAFYSLGVVFTVLTTGILLTIGISWRILFIGTGSVTIVSSLLFFPKDPSIDESGESVHWSLWVSCIRQPLFWLLALTIFFGGAAEAAFTFWSASYIQIHFDTLAYAGGIGTALFASAMALGRISTGNITKDHFSDRWLLLSVSVLGLLISLGVYMAPSITLFYALMFLSGLTVAPYWPTIQSVSTSYVEADPTLLFILLSCAGIPGIGTATWIMGYIGDLYGLKKALIVIPCCYLMLILLFGLLLYITRKKAPQY